MPKLSEEEEDNIECAHIARRNQLLRGRSPRANSEVPRMETGKSRVDLERKMLRDKLGSLRTHDDYE